MVQKTSIAKAILRKEVGSITPLHLKLYSKVQQNSILPVHEQTHRKVEQKKEPRNKSKNIWPTNFQGGHQKDIME